MAFNSLITSSVDLAFKTAGDLTKSVKFVNSTVGTYNFADQSYTETDDDTENIDAIVTSKRRPGLRAQDRAVVEASVIFKTADVGSMDIYDTIKFDDYSWKIESYNDNGYVVEAVVVREL